MPFSTERLVPHRSAADCYFSHCFSWHCMRTGYFCSLFLLIMMEFVNQKVLFPAFSTSSFDLVTLLGRNFSFGMLLTGAPFYGLLIAFSKQAWCFTAPRIAWNSSLRFPIRSARSSHCFWAGTVLCFLLPGLDLFFASLCQWWKSCYCCFKNMKTMYVGIWGIYGHIIVTLCEHCEMTREKHSLSFTVKFHAKPNSARMWASSEHVRAAHCAWFWRTHKTEIACPGFQVSLIWGWCGVACSSPLRRVGGCDLDGQRNWEWSPSIVGRTRLCPPTVPCL